MSAVSGSGDPELLLSDETHYSYPFPVTDEHGVIACVPENADRGRAARYRFVDDRLVHDADVLGEALRQKLEHRTVRHTESAAGEKEGEGAEPK